MNAWKAFDAEVLIPESKGSQEDYLLSRAYMTTTGNITQSISHK